MINGINFITQKVDYKSLREILLTVNAEEYYWCVGDSDVYEMPPRKNILPKGIYSGASILEILNRDTFYVFTELFAFDSLKDASRQKFDDYINGNCKIAIFIVDCNCYSVYVKDDLKFESVKNYAKRINCRRVKILDETNAEFHFDL